MKKVLALVLTLAMLLSCMAVGLSAARVVTENKTENYFWNFQAGNSYNPINVGSQSNFDVELDVRLDAADSALTGWSGLAVGPCITTTGIGIGTSAADATIPYTFNVGEWYHVKFTAAGEISVNGAVVGTDSDAMTLYDGNQAFYSWKLVSIDNFSVGSYFNDFTSPIEGQGQQLKEENVTYANENVAVAENAYWHFQAGNSYNPINVGNQGSGFDVEFDVKLDAADSALTGWSGLAVGPCITATGIGVGEGAGDATIAYTFDVNKWYHVKFDAVDGGVDIYVDGALVGNVAKEMTLYDGNQAFYSWKLVSIDNFAVGSYFNDFTNPIEGQGEQLKEEVENGRWDLGLKYWNFQAGNSYNPVNVGNQANGSFDVELDFKLDAADSALTGWSGLADGPCVTTTGIGIGATKGDATIAYTFEVDEWYHLLFKANGDIYVDGAYVGNDSTTMTLYDGNQAFYSWNLVSIDNFKVGSFFDDMEGAGIGGQGQQLAYEIKTSSIFDFVTPGTPGGEAYEITTGWTDKAHIPGSTAQVFTYWDWSGANPQGTDYIINFNLALMSNIDDAEGTWVELWANTASQRFKVGTKYTGRDEDLTAFDWGEATKDNFHNVTYVMKGSFGTAQIYVDQTLVWEGAVTKPWTDRWIGGVWNGTAIVDNYKIYTMDGDEIGANFSDRPECMKHVDLDAADYCATNGHVPGYTDKTIVETCYSLGQYTVNCAVCDGIYGQYDIDMIAHNYADYDINRKTEDGLVYTYCRNNGCVEKRYTTLPEDYAGTLYAYFDMQDDFINCINGGWDEDAWTIDEANEGYLKFDRFWAQREDTGEWHWSCNNYNIVSNNFLNNVPAKDYSISLDFIYNGMFSASDVDRHDDGRPGYGHTMYFWTSGSDSVSVKAGYNADEKKIFIQSNAGEANQDVPFGNGAFKTMLADYELIEGEEYNITLAVKYNVHDYDWTTEVDAIPECWMVIYVNGEEILRFDMNETDDAYFNVPFAANKNDLGFIILRNFGVGISVNNLAIGSSDFVLNGRVYVGDVDGDYALTSADALLMRKYLAKVVDDSAIFNSRADLTADGAINAKDQLMIRKALAA